MVPSPGRGLPAEQTVERVPGGTGSRTCWKPTAGAGADVWTCSQACQEEFRCSSVGARFHVEQHPEESGIPPGLADRPVKRCPGALDLRSLQRMNGSGRRLLVQRGAHPGRHKEWCESPDPVLPELFTEMRGRRSELCERLLGLPVDPGCSAPVFVDDSDSSWDVVGAGRAVQVRDPGSTQFTRRRLIARSRDSPLDVPRCRGRPGPTRFSPRLSRCVGRRAVDIASRGRRLTTEVRTDRRIRRREESIMRGQAGPRPTALPDGPGRGPRVSCRASG